MISRIYTVYDKVAEEGGPLFLAKNDKVAVRMFKNMMNSEQNGQFRPEFDDYSLIFLGNYTGHKPMIETTDESGTPVNLIWEGEVQ